ncbi:protein kinase [Grosmannia clavigera kw1407]|uniref:non-specific serine/threonine protein kinase n=1 Tax=Grosmannia clavigera (strain kw1407 / UAMH 11150) TaxID=655863 RepID=F0XCG8_GROCL|nr:protein kinase [Grosmannia clavigera kw1407]EFX03445.1 protein kinase [Grosmannia clavigera kw1407]
MASSVQTKQTSSHPRKRQSRRRGLPLADSIDILDKTGFGGAYHHGGPYDATLAAVNKNKKYAPLEAVKDSNLEALRATPKEYIVDSLERHIPLQGTGTIPSGMPDMNGNIMNYKEGADLMREADAPGGAFMRYDFIKYHPDDLKGKGEPSFSIERSLKEQSNKPYRHKVSASYSGGSTYEMKNQFRPLLTPPKDANASIRRSSFSSSATGASWRSPSPLGSGLRPRAQDDTIYSTQTDLRRNASHGNRITEGLKRRLDIAAGQATSDRLSQRTHPHEKTSLVFTSTRPAAMSLVPFHPQEGREIVLRHRNAIVVRDPSSQRLEIRGIAECPTCHRPMRASSPTRSPFASDVDGDFIHRHEGYVDPNYFRMLRAGHHQLRGTDHPSHGTPSSPLRRFFQPLVGQSTPGGNSSPAGSTASGALSEDEDAASGGSPKAGATATLDSSPIGKEAFSPHYFKTFFVEERELGRGGKGVVLLVRHEIDGLQLGHFACKRVPVGDDHAWLEKVLVEVELLAKLSHPNLVSYRHVWLENVTLNRFGPSVACAFILQQYCNGGDLQNYIIGDQPKEATKEELKAQMRRRSRGQAERPRNPFSPSAASRRQLQFDEIYSLFRDITSGLAYLHAANYIHRDLKPSNCLLHREGRNLTCLISDFGEVQPENVVRRSTGTTGTISYCAPEVLRRDANGLYGNFTTKSDIFSLGMILYFMCFGRLPYRSANTLHEELEDITQLRAEISNWKGFQYERRERPDLPSKLYQLLTKLLSVQPAERPSATDVLLVMRTTESGLDGFSRNGNSTMSQTMNMSGRRLQNLDSGVSSGTSMPDTVNTRKGSLNSLSSPADHLDEFAVVDSDDASSPKLTPRDSLQKSRPSTLTLTHSQERGLNRSPERRTAAVSDSSGPRSLSPGAPAPSSPQNTNTPLLMPPPATFLGEIQHRTRLAQHFVLLFSRQHAEAVTFLLRITLFFLKIVTLAKPCWPFMAQWGIGAPLVFVAGLDLGLPDESGGRLGFQQDEAPQYRHRPRPRSPFWERSWRVSMLLLALHFFILWTASHSGVLCTVNSHKPWTEW